MGLAWSISNFMLVENQTVTENVIIGLDTPRFALNLKKYDQEISDLADQFGIHIDPTAKIWQLSVGEQQRVEILKFFIGAQIFSLWTSPLLSWPPRKLMN